MRTPIEKPPMGPKHYEQWTRRFRQAYSRVIRDLCYSRFELKLCNRKLQQPNLSEEQREQLMLGRLKARNSVMDLEIEKHNLEALINPMLLVPRLVVLPTGEVRDLT